MIVARGFVQLLQYPVRLDAAAHQLPPQFRVPETFILDRIRLAQMRDLIDMIALECSVVIASRQLLAKHKLRPREDDEVVLQLRIDVLLGEKDVNFTSVAAELFKYVQCTLENSGAPQHQLYAENDSGGSGSSSSSSAAVSSSPAASLTMLPPVVSPHTPPVALSTVVANSIGNERLERAAAAATTTSTAAVLVDWAALQHTVNKALSDALAPHNPVLALFSKRVGKLLLRALCGMPYLHKLPDYSLQSKGQEKNIARLVDTAQKVFRQSMRVYAPFYNDLLRTIAQQEQQQQIAAAAASSSTARV
jgi:hypothetical protein